MKCNGWIVDRYTPKRNHKIQYITDSRVIPREKVEFVIAQIPAKVRSVENLRLCTGMIKVRIETGGDYDSLFQYLDYYCDVCYHSVNDSRLPSLDESLERFLQSYVDGLE